MSPPRLPADLRAAIAFDWYCFIAWGSRTLNFWRVLILTRKLDAEAYQTHLCSVAYVRECHSRPWRLFYRTAERLLGEGHCRRVFEDDMR